jgi:hypothetical protein
LGEIYKSVKWSKEEEDVRMISGENKEMNTNVKPSKNNV